MMLMNLFGLTKDDGAHPNGVILGNSTVLPDSEPDAAAIRADIAKTRHDIEEKVSAIKNQVSSTVESGAKRVRWITGVGETIKRNPWSSLGIAVGAGVLLGRTRTSQAVIEHSVKLSGNFAETVVDQLKPQIGTVQLAVAQAVASFLADRVKSLLENLGRR